MVEPRKRASASLKVKYKSTTPSQFIQQFGLDISHAGIFIKTKTPLEPGALIRLELQLSDGVPVIVGSGRVRWRRQTAGESQTPAGMGIEFTRLDPESRRFVDSIVDGREGRPSRFEQADGAEHAAPSPKIASSAPPSAPPISAPSPANIQAATPEATPPPTPLPAPTPPPTPPQRGRPSLPPSAPGLFAGSRLGTAGAPATDPFVEAPTQSSFFAHGRVAGAAPSNASQNPLRTGGARDPSITPARADATDRLVDHLFADAIPKPGEPDSDPVTGDPSDDLITSEFRGPDLYRDETAITSERASTAPSTQGRPHDPPPPLPRPASQRPAELVLKAPSQFPSPPTSGTSGFPKPAMSKTLLVSGLALLGLAAAVAFFYLH